MKDLRKIKRALISVSDKTGVVAFAQTLEKFGVEIISTGGTAKILQENGVKVREVAEVTGFPEMLDGRVKTLHPKIHGALLGKRDNAAHAAAMSANAIEPIDLVVINLYPFEETIVRADVTLEQAIEQIDIGGPAMIRSAAKNWHDVAILTDGRLYEPILEELKNNNGALSAKTRQRLAALAFTRTCRYDLAIANYLENFLDAEDRDFVAEYHPFGATTEELHFSDSFDDADDFDELDEFDDFEDEEAKLAGLNGHPFIAGESETENSLFGEFEALDLFKAHDLRYGENPHQTAALYETDERGGIAQAEWIGGKEMSYNNYVDADAAWNLVNDFTESACAIIKHTNPSGLGIGANGAEAYHRALATDSVSAFGGIVAFNQTVDAAAARAVTEIFTEVIVAPDYELDALEILKAKKNLRILRVDALEDEIGLEYKQISGGFLIQTKDKHILLPENLKVVTQRQPTAAEIRALLLAWKVCRHVKSNAIVLANEFQTVGVGAGQMNRVDSVKIAALRAARTELSLTNAVLASDAFFPFRDGLDEAAQTGITAIIQPGGSVRDAEVIQAADEHGLAMVFTAIRHFKH